MTYFNLFPSDSDFKSDNNYHNVVNDNRIRDDNNLFGAGFGENVIGGWRNYISKSGTMTSLSMVIGAVLMLSTLPTLINGQRNNFFTSTLRREMSPYKGYSGVRVRPDSLILVYTHDQTVAVVEVGPDRELFSCELIEI